MILEEGVIIIYRVVNPKGEDFFTSDREELSRMFFIEGTKVFKLKRNFYGDSLGPEEELEIKDGKILF